MSGKNEPVISASTTEIDDDAVRDYLIQHADFLQNHPDMLDYLHIPHASGSAISLVEKQVDVLRERNIDMRRRLGTLTNNARDNDKLFEQTRALVLKLLEARSRTEIFEAFNDAMKNDYQVEHASMILFAEDAENTTGCRIESAESAKIEIGALLKGRKAVCGALREEELAYLFPNSSGIGSAALMPLCDGDDLGVVAVGSSDPNRYSGAMGTLFLTHIADVVVRLLPRLEQH